MKSNILKLSLLLLTAGQITPAHAMFARLSKLALQSGKFNTGTQLIPAAIAGSNVLQSRSTLPARTLASKQGQDYSRYNKQEKSESDPNDSGSRWHYWRSFFSRTETATQLLGCVIFGWHLWWSEDDICQKPEDFEDTQKLERTKKFIQNYTGGDKYNRILDFLIQAVKADPRLAQELAPITSKNVAALVTNYFGYELISKIMDNQPDRVASFVQPTLDNFAALATDPYGISTIIKIMDAQPDCVASFAQLALDNFAALATNHLGCKLISKIMDNQPDRVATFAQLTLDNFAALAKNYFGISTVIKIINTQPDCVASFAQPTVDNFTALATNYFGCELILKIMHTQPDCVASFAQLTLDNFTTLTDSLHGYLLIEQILDAQPTTVTSFAQLILDNFTALATNYFGLQLIRKIMDAQPDTIITFEALAKKHGCNNFPDLIDKLRSIESVKTLFESAELTQTGKHFQTLLNHNLKKIVIFSPKDAENIEIFKSMIGTIVATERIEQVAGNYTFVHTYPWNIRFLQDIDAHLRSIAYDAPLQPLSLRFITAPNKDTGDKHRITREDILENGSSYYAYDGNKQKHMIFINYGLFSGYNPAFDYPYASNSLFFLANDRCENPPKVLLDKVFKHLNLAYIHLKYKKEFTELERLHREASMFGAGILFSFTPEMLEKSVYVCYGGGSKRKVEIEGIGETDNVKLILDTLRTAPEKIKDLDSLEFVFVATKDCGLNRLVQESGHLKIIPFNAANPEKYALYEQERDKLVAKIKADKQTGHSGYCQQNKLKRREQTQREMQEYFARYNCLNGCKQSRIQES